MAGRIYQSAVTTALGQQSEEIGLLLGGNSWEYPFWLMAGKAMTRTSPDFVSLCFSNPCLENPEFPDIIIVSSTSNQRIFHGLKFETLFKSGELSVIRILRD